MIHVAKVFVVFVLIIVLVRLRWKIGYVLLTASGALAILYAMPFAALAATIQETVVDPVTIKLFFALTLIRVFEMVLREKQVLAKMTEASRSLLRRQRAVIISMPLLIGLLPSLGGAYFSAPMVEESTRRLKMSPEEKGFINYWFRHPWELILPLYPGVLLASAVTTVELHRLIGANFFPAAIIFLSGFFFSMRKMEDHGDATPSSDKHAVPVQTIGKRPMLSFLPVVMVLIMVMVLRIELHYALGITVGLLTIFYRFSLKELVRVLSHGFTLDVMVLIFGTMLFKFMMENSGAVALLSSYLADEGISPLPLLVLLPFVSGLLTGLTVGFVGSTFPLLISIAGGVHLDQIALAFAAGYVGVLLSPVHLCLVLTREYFKADLWGMYKKTIPACGIIMAGAFLEYILL